jgi:hypothetical protein
MSQRSKLKERPKLHPAVVYRTLEDKKGKLVPVKQSRLQPEKITQEVHIPHPNSTESSGQSLADHGLVGRLIFPPAGNSQEQNYQLLEQDDWDFEENGFGDPGVFSVSTLLYQLFKANICPSNPHLTHHLTPTSNNGRKNTHPCTSQACFSARRLPWAHNVQLVGMTPPQCTSASLASLKCIFVVLPM